LKRDKNKPNFGPRKARAGAMDQVSLVKYDIPLATLVKYLDKEFGVGKWSYEVSKVYVRSHGSANEELGVRRLCDWAR